MATASTAARLRLPRKTWITTNSNLQKTRAGRLPRPGPLLGGKYGHHETVPHGRQKGLYYRRRQGIGKAIAEAFIQAGAEFTIVDVNMEKAQAVAQAFSEQYGKHITAFCCDVSDPQQVAQMADMVTQTYGTIDFAINNVGIVNFFPVESVRPEDWKRVIDVNLFGTFLVRAGRRQGDDRAEQTGHYCEYGFHVCAHHQHPADHLQLLHQ